MSVAELIEKVHGLGESEKNDVIVAVVEKMSVLSLTTLVKAIETKFDVKASGGGGMMMMAPAAAAPAEEKEQTEFDLVLKDAGQKKIAVIKEVRAITGLDLKGAKDLVDKAPATVKAKISKEDAEKAKAQLEEAGAVVEIK